MYHYGIDLGTTYSCIARADEKGNVEILKNIEGKNITPSVVEFISPTEIVAGEVAKGNAMLVPDNVSQYIKRSMGKHDEKHEYHGKNYTPEQISAFVLKKLVSDAERQMKGEKIKDVVITVPAYFGFDEREATENAGKIAGLNVLSLVNEPTAAAIAYSSVSSGKEDKVLLVYDLGGGTFDVTVAEIVGEKITVKSTQGNHSLGGKDWDAELLSHFVKQLSEKAEVNEDEIYEDSALLNELALKTEDVKKDLTLKSKASFPISMGRGKRVQLEVTLEKFNEITRHHLISTIELTKIALSQAATKTSSKGKPCNQIDEIIFVGGSTRMKQVAEAVKAEFGMEPHLHNPDEAVASGAALLAKFIAENPPQPEQKGGVRTGAEQRFGEVTSKSYGIEVDDKGIMKLSHVILQNDEIPISNTQTYYTVAANQRQVNIVVYESNVMQRTTELSFGKQIAEGILQLPAGLPDSSPLDVTFSLDRSGMLNITAIERSQGMKCNIIVETKGLTETEVKKLQQQTSQIRLADDVEDVANTDDKPTPPDSMPEKKGEPDGDDPWEM